MSLKHIVLNGLAYNPDQGCQCRQSIQKHTRVQDLPQISETIDINRIRRLDRSPLLSLLRSFLLLCRFCLENEDFQSKILKWENLSSNVTIQPLLDSAFLKAFKTP